VPKSLLGVFGVAIGLMTGGMPAIAQTDQASGPSTPRNIDDGERARELSIYEQLVPDHRQRLDRVAKYYVRLDDGTCLNAFRLIRAIELREDEKRLRREELLEALGALRETGTEPPKPGHQAVKHEKLPPWIEYREFCYVFGPAGDMQGFQGSAGPPSDTLTWLNTGRAHRQGLIVSFGSYADVYIDGMTKSFAVPRRLEETVLLAPAGPAPEGVHPDLRIFRAVGRQPTPQQLAEYLVKRNRKLIEYEIPKLVHHQPTATRTISRGNFVETITEPKGQPTHTYRWVKREFELRLAAKPAPRPKITEKERATPAEQAP